MKEFALTLVRAIWTIVVWLLTSIVCLFGLAIEAIYEVMCIIRYWYVRGLYEIVVRIERDEPWTAIWNANIENVCKYDVTNAVKILKMKIDD